MDVRVEEWEELAIAPTEPRRGEEEKRTGEAEARGTAHDQRMVYSSLHERRRGLNPRLDDDIHIFTGQESLGDVPIASHGSLKVGQVGAEDGARASGEKKRRPRHVSGCTQLYRIEVSLE